MEWNIQARAHFCQACQRPFTAGEAFHTILFDEKAAYVRRDLCRSCWAECVERGEAGSPGCISHWQSIYQPPPAAPPEPIQKETAETVLRKLIEENDSAHLPARFILAVMLERKRILKVKAQFVQDEQRFFVYEHGRTGEVFTIADPDLQLDQLEAVQRDVARLLQPSPASVPGEEADAGVPPSSPAVTETAP